MKLSSARELKQTLLGVARAEFTEPRTFAVRAAAAGGAGPVVERAVPEPVAAIGVAPVVDRKNEFHLAVRIYEGQERNRERLLREIAPFAREVEIVSGVRYAPRALTLRAGGSCGHYNIAAGTLGAFVEDDRNYYILSNNHVLADSDNGRSGDPILQPGPVDIVDGRYRVIGRLDYAVPLRTGGVDAALATFDDDVTHFEPWRYAGIGDLDPRPVSDRFSVTRVAKRGRSTTVTKGRVSVFELDGVAIDYGSPVGTVVFDDQIEVVGDPPERPFSQGGDSGSLIIDRDTLRPYALLYGGGPDDMGIDRTVAHFIPEVLDELGVRFVT